LGTGGRGSGARYPDRYEDVACSSSEWYPVGVNPKRDAVRMLRRRGLSYQEIGKRLGVARSSIHYMVQGIALTKPQLHRLMKKQRKNWARLNRDWKKHSVSEEMRRKQRQTMLRWWQSHPERREAAREIARALRIRQHKSHNPSNPPQALDRRTYQMCLRSAPRLGYHPNWNYVMTRGGGYFAVQCHDHPHRTPRGYVPVHRVVLECYLRRLLHRTEVTHHQDGNPSNNAPDNLLCTSSHAEHRRLHIRPRAMLTFNCGWCGHSVTRRKRHLCRTKSGLHFCSGRCASFMAQARERSIRRDHAD
jgi:transcriptional regulator with XRE-family HTH domain